MRFSKRIEGFPSALLQFLRRGASPGVLLRPAPPHVLLLDAPATAASRLLQCSESQILAPESPLIQICFKIIVLVLDSYIFAFWAKTSVDPEPRRIRLKSNSYTTSNILDTVTAASIQLHQQAYSSTTSTACSKSKFTPPIPDEVEVLKSHLDSMAEENGQLKSTVNVMQDQLTSVMSLLQKFTGTQLNNTTNEDVPSTSDGDDGDMHDDD